MDIFLLIVLVTRPSVAGAVLQTPLLRYALIRSSFSSKSTRHFHSQTVWAKDLKLEEDVHLSQMSSVMCHVSNVTCHMLHVNCHIFFLFYFIFGKRVALVGWRVCYQWGLTQPLFTSLALYWVEIFCGFQCSLPLILMFYKVTPDDFAHPANDGGSLK